MIHYKTEMREMPENCWKCTMPTCCGEPEEKCRRNNCPLAEMPAREEAYGQILECLRTINLDGLEEFKIGMNNLLDKLGFKEEKEIK